MGITVYGYDRLRFTTLANGLCLQSMFERIKGIEIVEISKLWLILSVVDPCSAHGPKPHRNVRKKKDLFSYFIFLI